MPNEYKTLKVSRVCFSDDFLMTTVPARESEILIGLTIYVSNTIRHFAVMEIFNTDLLLTYFLLLCMIISFLPYNLLRVLSLQYDIGKVISKVYINHERNCATR